MTTFTLTTPFTTGGLSNSITVTSLQITDVWFASIPQLAPIGTGELEITLTDPVSGWQEQITYQDASVLAFFASPATAPPSGATYSDVISIALFSKLIADGKLPPGTVSTH